jgi:hypothetical protein
VEDVMLSPPKTTFKKIDKNNLPKRPMFFDDEVRDAKQRPGPGAYKGKDLN